MWQDSNAAFISYTRSPKRKPQCWWYSHLCIWLSFFIIICNFKYIIEKEWRQTEWVQFESGIHLSPVALSYCMNPLGNFISELWNTSCINCYCLTVQPCSLWCQEISKNKQRNKLKNVNLKHFAITFNYDIYLWCLVGRVCAKSTTFCLLQFINYWFIIESSE